ncbi:FAD-binding protein, partial [bacterium]|nr:FAD-binding protein [bacterium]
MNVEKMNLKKKWKNWAGTTTCTPYQTKYPQNEDEIQSLVQYCFDEDIAMRVVGAGHSYNDIFHTSSDGILLSLEKFAQVESIDALEKTVWIQAGIRLPKLISYLKKSQMSLPSLGTNVFDNFVGACSTGYHGSGINFSILASLILEIEIITGQGQKKIIKKGQEHFDAIAVGLGVFGVITKLKIQCEKLSTLEIIEESTNLQEIEKNIDQLLQENDHFKFIWVPHTDKYMTWRANRSDKEHSSLLKKIKSYFFIGIIINNFFHELLLFFALFNRPLVKKINHLMADILIPTYNQSVYPSHWAFFLPHILKQDVVEYSFPIKHSFDVFKKLQKEIEQKNYMVDTPIEVRFVKGDNFWLSPASGGNSCYIGTKVHFPLRQKPEYLEYFKMVYKVM